MTRKQQDKLQFFENNWMIRIAGVNRIVRRRKEGVRKEVVVK